MEQRTSTKIRIATCMLGVAALLYRPAAGAAEEAVAPATAAAASNRATAELMKSIRAATFEVVLKKAEADPLQYEKPLPFDLLPFAERNDKYKSIGTAFAIAPDSFATAAHVATAASGSQLGIPALRDAQGNVYPIERVTRFSLDRDFIVFTVAGSPRVTPLPTSTSFQIDTPVLAVGNALGEGIVARDGTLTSETPEEQNGSWKWLRFSAPASPGNSGGPLLDSQGRVIGIIARKSANENLNYALPIALVLNAAANKGSIDSRFTVSVPVMPARKTVKVQASFDLPLRFGDFDRKIIAINNEQFESARRQLLQESAADIYPRGKSSRLLADTLLTNNPALISQQADGTWDVPRNSSGANAQLGNDGSVWMSTQSGAAVFRIRYPGDLAVDKGRGDSKLLSEQLLKVVNLSRNFGGERVRITSLGNAGKPLEFKDDFGRTWQQWRYPMPFADSTMIVTALPTPEGYVGFWRSSGGAGLERTSSEIRFLMNFLQVSYTGSLPQWRSFLADTHLRPESFGKWKTALDPSNEVSLEFPRLTVKVDKQVLALTEQSQLNVLPGTLLDGDRPAWDVLAAQFSLEPRPSPGIAALRPLETRSGCRSGPRQPVGGHKAGARPVQRQPDTQPGRRLCPQGGRRGGRAAG